MPSLIRLAALMTAATLAAPAWGQAGSDSPTPRAEDAPTATERWAIHAQATFTVQATPGFASPYTGPNSLAPYQARETFDGTLYFGVRPWRGLELWINPEVDQGFGLSNTLGVAGFPSAEAYKVGKRAPYVRLQRLFARQTFALGGETSAVTPGQNQLGGSTTVDRLVVTFGKFGVADVFDTNRYAHDPRADFLNWAIVDTGSFDYAADAWGYSSGAAVEWYQGHWTLRGGLFNLSKIPNGETLEPRFGQSQQVVELEHRHTLGDKAGAVRLTLFRNRGRFGRFDEALRITAAIGGPPDTAPVRRPRSRVGASVNAEQALSDSVGVFLRAGLADGAIEPYDFTDIDRTVAGGVSFNGKRWGRAEDNAGLALVVNDISAEHRRYLAAGGIGLLIGDGRLPNPGREAIVEAFYSLTLIKPVGLTLDYQFVNNPGYDRDRGPAHVFGARLHGAF